MTHEHDRGLDYDLPRIVERNRLGRRGLLGIGAGVGLVALTGCGDDDSTSSPSSSDPVDRSAPSSAPPAGGPGGDSTVEVADGEIPEETAGPYPGDGSNGPNVLTDYSLQLAKVTGSVDDGCTVTLNVPV